PVSVDTWQAAFLTGERGVRGELPPQCYVGIWMFSCVHFQIENLEQKATKGTKAPAFSRPSFPLLASVQWIESKLGCGCAALGPPRPPINPSQAIEDFVPIFSTTDCH